MENSNLRILITNITLAGRTGTEMYVRDLACELRERGHEPLVYSPEPGPIANELRTLGVPYFDDPAAPMPEPDLVHGHHHPTAMAALLRFPAAPGIFVCHDRSAWHDEPPRHPRLRLYVGVDQNVCERLAEEADLPDERLRLVPNGVDLRRFRRRGPLPARPRRALVFSNQAREDTHLPAVRAACEREGIALEAVGLGVGRSVAEPERLLGRYDLVFAKGRCALEALACGTAVIVCDRRGVGPMVVSTEVDALRRLSFGMSTYTASSDDAEAIIDRIRRYDPLDAAKACDRIRATAGLSGTVDRLLELYREVLAAHRAERPCPAEEARATAAYVARFGRLARLHEALEGELEGELDGLRREIRTLQNLRSVRLARRLRQLATLPSRLFSPI